MIGYEGEEIVKDGFVYSISPRRDGSIVVYRPSWDGRRAGRSLTFGPFESAEAAKLFVAQDNPRSAT